MKPHRMRMAHHLILSYGLYKRMEIYRPTQLQYHDMTRFHADDYIHFLQHVTPDNMNEYSTELSRFNIDVDWYVTKTINIIYIVVHYNFLMHHLY